MQTKIDQKDDIKMTHRQLDLWRDRLSGLEDKLELTAAEGRAELDDKLRTLQRKRRELKRSLEAAADGTSDVSWGDLRADLEDTVEDFRSFASEVYDNVRKA